MREKITIDEAVQATNLPFNTLKMWVYRNSIPHTKDEQGRRGITIADIVDYIMNRHQTVKMLRAAGFDILVPEWAKEKNDAPVRITFWNEAWQINADIPGREGYHQTITLPNYCNERDAVSVADVIERAHKRETFGAESLAEQSEAENEHL